MVYRFLSLFVTVNVLLFSTSIQAAETSDIFYRDFWNPILLGKPLAYCETPDTNCGKSAADLYCKSMGYGTAVKIIKAHNTGIANYISIRKTCIGWKCNGFKLIRCQSTLPQEKPEPYHYRLRQYSYPRMNHYRIDWCYENKSGCGKKAADSFCRHKGYHEAKSFVKDDNPQATKAIGNQALCFGNECRGYKRIDCYR